MNVNNLNLTKLLLKIIKSKKVKIGKKVKIKFVKDRPGHDLRYALNSKKIRKKLNWKPQKTLNLVWKKHLIGMLKIINFLILFLSKNFLRD